MSQQLANFAESTLSASITSGDTTATVTDGSSFPSSGDFIVRIDDEFIKVTARSTNTLTITRAQEGSTATSHSSASLVKLVLTKTTLEEYFGDNYIFGTAASRPATGKIGQIYQASDIDASWRYQSNGWELVHPCFVPYNGAIDLTGWTSFNLSTSAWTVTQGLLAVTTPQSAGFNLRGYYHNKPAAPFTATMAIRIPATWQQTDRIGITLTNATYHWTYVVSSLSSIQLQTQGFTNTTSNDGGSTNRAIPVDTFIYIRFRDDNSNWYHEYSYDNKNWAVHAQTGRNNGTTPTKIGIVRNRVDTDFPNDVFSCVLGYWES
jgi:hypothetical protein